MPSIYSVLLVPTLLRTASALALNTAPSYAASSTSAAQAHGAQGKAIKYDDYWTAYEPTYLTTAPSFKPSPVTQLGLPSHGVSIRASIPPEYAPSQVPAYVQYGEITNYDAANQPGACGEGPGIQPNEAAAAINWQVYDQGKGGETNGTSSLCFRELRVWRGSQDKGVNLFVRDRCEGCRPQDVDIMGNVFEDYFASTAAGRVSMTWSFVDPKTKTAN